MLSDFVLPAPRQWHILDVSGCKLLRPDGHERPALPLQTDRKCADILAGLVELRAPAGRQGAFGHVDLVKRFSNGPGCKVSRERQDMLQNDPASGEPDGGIARERLVRVCAPIPLFEPGEECRCIRRKTRGLNPERHIEDENAVGILVADRAQEIRGARTTGESDDTGRRIPLLLCLPPEQDRVAAIGAQ